MRRSSQKKIDLQMNIQYASIDVKKTVSELSLLFDINQILDFSDDLQTALYEILKKLAHDRGMTRGTLTILNRKTGEIHIETAYGLSKRQRELGKVPISHRRFPIPAERAHTLAERDLRAPSLLSLLPSVKQHPSGPAHGQTAPAARRQTVIEAFRFSRGSPGME